MTASTATAHRRAPVLPPLQIGRHVIESPVVLAPMAGITNRAFRRLCREYGTAGLEAGRCLGRDQPLRLRDGDDPRPRRAHPRDDAAHLARPRGAPPLGAALLRRPGHRRARGPDARHRGPRRPHRPQLRLPRAQGDPQGRRCGAAVEDRPVPRHRRRRRPRGAAVRRARHREDAGRHRRRPRDLPRRRADRRGRGRRGRGAARAHRRPGVLGPGRLVGDRPAQGGRDVGPRARQRRHLVGRGRPGDGARRPAATGSSSGGAASGGRGCSPTSRRRSPAPTSGCSPGCAR